LDSCRPKVDPKSVTQHFPTRQLRFFLTAPAPCPYLPDRLERKVFAHLPLSDGANVNDSLTQVGFRRSQNIAYRPACETCSACVSARIPASDYQFSRSERKVLNRNVDLERNLVEAEATMEQFDLLRRYLAPGMLTAAWRKWAGLILSPWSRTPRPGLHMIEYRQPSKDNGPGDLIGCALVDLMSDGLSLVYSFYEPDMPKRSLGSLIILDHLQQASLTNLPYVYLGYWVRGSEKMNYKVRFSP